MNVGRPTSAGIRLLRDADMASASSPDTIAPVLGALFAAGATLALVSMAFPQPRGTNTVGLYAIYGTAYVVAAGLVVVRHRIPAPWLALALSAGTTLITAAIIMTHGRTTAYAMYYVWVALVAAYYFTWPHVTAQIALVALAYGAPLLLDHPPGAAEQWLISIGTVVVAAGLVGVLRRAIARLVTRLADTARKDALTGLLNRRGFVDLLDVELERSRRAERPLCVLAIDIDDFKHVNDRHGTAFGDRALTRLAADLERMVRRIDATARVAGEEFAVLLPDTEPHSAYLLAERLRQRLAAAETAELSLSIGVACAPKHGRTQDELMLAGDRALGAAKALGGDRVVLYDPEVVASLTAGAASADLRREESIAAVLVLAETLDIRDSGTARHSQTVSSYAATIARHLGMPEDAVERVRLAGVVHDVGKIGVPDAILQKPGPLDDAEFAEMMNHAELGARILAAANLEDLSAWVHAHHERPDGRGYPRGLAGEAIPLEARILAVADSYEAMTSDRVYRLAMAPEDAQAELRRCAGKQFDPRVVDAFLRTAAREPLPA